MKILSTHGSLNLYCTSEDFLSDILAKSAPMPSSTTPEK